MEEGTGWRLFVVSGSLRRNSNAPFGPGTACGGQIRGWGDVPEEARSLSYGFVFSGTVFILPSDIVSISSRILSRRSNSRSRREGKVSIARCVKVEAWEVALHPSRV